MKIKLSYLNNSVQFGVDKDLIGRHGVGQGGNKIELVANVFTVDVDPAVVKSLHPDVLALVCVSAYLPWMSEPVKFPKSVSSKFAKVLYEVFGIKAENTSKALKPRECGLGLALSFSGGLDSVALSCLMPEDTHKITFIRKDHPRIEPRLDNTKDVVIQTVSQFDGVVQIPSNLEYIAGPYLQFPTWTALSIPCMLLADSLKLGAIAYGSIDGSSIVKNGQKFHKPVKPDANWSQLFNAAGLVITKPVAGLSDIGTQRVAEHYGVEKIAMSCTLGELHKPCMTCSKCFRKYVVKCAADNCRPDNKILNEFLQHKAVGDYLLSEYPLYFQHVLMYSFSRFDRDKLPTIYKLFYDKLFLEPVNINWVEKYDEEAIIFYAPEPRSREYVLGKLRPIMSPLEGEDKKILRTWDLFKVRKNNCKKLSKIQAALESELAKLQASNAVSSRSAKNLLVAAKRFVRPRTRIKRTIRSLQKNRQ